MTEFLGYRFASGEGKVMGLAPYGDPGRFIQQFRDMIKTTPDGRYGVDMSYFNYQYHGRSNWFSKKFFDTFGPPRKPESELTDHYKDVSAALQMRTEEVGLYMAKWLRQQTGLNKVCLAGGVCLNSVMNGRILREGVFDEVVVQPAANDAGTALGGCFWLWNTVMRKPRKYIFEHAYLGPAWSDEQYERAICQEIKSKHQVEIEKVKDAPSLAASMLSDGKIIGWFQGRMEMGPRALGNRSILADPRVGKMKDLLNERVKFRESFRPFAPSILEEKIGQWFDCGYPSPYMILVYNVLLEKRKYIPAVTHVDGTGRVHSVNRKHNPRYYGLLTEFERLTGVPIVLNTSFNIRGQPVVNKPEQAIECFVNTGIDVLFLGDYVLSKQVVSTAKDRN